jgi:hypothetical protein
LIDTTIEDRLRWAGAVFKNDTTITELLLSADADPLAGSPSALETARFFEREDSRGNCCNIQRERLVATRTRGIVQTMTISRSGGTLVHSRWARRSEPRSVLVAIDAQ